MPTTKQSTKSRWREAYVAECDACGHRNVIFKTTARTNDAAELAALRNQEAQRATLARATAAIERAGLRRLIHPTELVTIREAGWGNVLDQIARGIRDGGAPSPAAKYYQEAVDRRHGLRESSSGARMSAVQYYLAAMSARE